MLISNISVDNYAQSFETPRKVNSSVTAPGLNILLGFYYARLFETPRINNHGVTEPSARIILFDESAKSFETPPKNNHIVTAPSVHITGSDSLKCQHKNITHRPGQKLPSPGK